ncbi:C3 and PZP-like alpha-2-macroglobulin domain-containing protein 8 [Schistocerca americana]|uniref:C3 and PZP-like alpha-2-macroglobulin domain-containing protein 8 n=1 Tax=Schistocerca americana TaxID=7009 RepID=UPI001F4FD72E|nr:C3 and PZP-like alpha-2-macroglobulin domain-containing protein 8 [Schistocerca americana]
MTAAKGGAMLALLQLVALAAMLHSMTAAETCDQSVTVVSPRTAVAGGATAVLVTLSGGPRRPPRPPLNVTLHLLAASGGDEADADRPIISRSSALVQGQAVIPVLVPLDAPPSCVLQAVVGGSVQTSSRLTLAGPLRHAILRPDRTSYSPGDTVHFWVLALDQSLRLPSGAAGSVCVRDPAGNCVARWPQVSLGHGVLSFSLPLSGAAPTGTWHLHLEADDRRLSGWGAAAAFNVSLPQQEAAGGGGGGGAGGGTARPLGTPASPWLGAGGSGGDEGGGGVGGGGRGEATQASAPEDEVAMAEEHFVELRFGRAVRRLYKPGLPFVGKVESVSTEKVVRVRVKVYDNTTAIYSQDLEITSGEAAFVVPAILADSELITLQAELVSVGGKEIDSHYVLAREPVRRWPGSSALQDCYLLVQGLERTFQPEERAHATVLSTCACERDVLAVVTAPGGRVLHWTEKRADAPPPPDLRPPPASVDGAAICRLNFSFEVQAVMAPTSQLLVYYVTEEGEPVSDVISFDVSLQHSAVSVSTEERDFWLPGQRLELRVTAEPNSLVCVVGGRPDMAGAAGAAEAVATAPPGAALGTAAAPAEDRNGTGSWSGGVLDFQQAGLDVFQRRCVRATPRGPRVAALRQQRAPTPGQAAASDGSGGYGLGALQLGVDHVWFWRCFNFSGSQQQHRTWAAAPPEPGQWTLTVFRSLGVAFSLPPTLRVGETAQVDVRIANSAASCMDVTALLSLTEGAHFASSGLLYVSEKLRLGPHGATSLVVRVVVTSPGVKNMTVEVSGYGGDSCRDTGGGNGTSPARSGGSTGSRSALSASVTRSASTLVTPEGLRRTTTDSAYFCANEKLVVSTPEDFQPEWLPAPRNRAGVVLEVRAAAPGADRDRGGGAGGAVGSGGGDTPPQPAAVVLLSSGRGAGPDSYLLALGDVSWLTRGPHAYGVRLASAETPGLVTGEFRTLWLSWERGLLSLGRGSHLHQGPLLSWRAPTDSLAISHIGLSAPWGTPAEFRLWNYNEEAGFSQVLHLDVPQPVVPGSEQGSLSVAGGLALPSSAASWLHPAQHATDIGEASSLVSTLASFSPLPTLDHRGMLLDQEAPSGDVTDVRRRLATQLQALLVFRKPDGSFGDHPTKGSHSGTVWALDVLNRAQAHVAVDPQLLTSAKRWLQARQRADGGFAPDDAATGDVETTAETLVALLAVGLETEGDEECCLRARYFLERSLLLDRSSAPPPLSAASLALALVASRSEVAAAAVARLRNVSANEEGDFGWPYHLSDARTGTLPRDRRLATTAAEYKASLYALMTYSMMGDLRSAEPVAKYLFYRSYLLDTHKELVYLCVRALWQLSSVAQDRERALTVSLATSGMELTDTLELRPGTQPARALPLPSLPTKVFVYATGAGCATVQGRVSYSTYAPASRTPLLDIWAAVEGEDSSGLRHLEGRPARLSIRVCFRWKSHRPSGVLRLEVRLFSGFQLSSWSGSVLVDSNGTTADVQHGSRADKVWFLMSGVTSQCAVCVQLSAGGVYPVTSSRPALARVYPAERPHVAAHVFFHSATLLTAGADDDLLTWFGASQQGGVQMGSNFSEVCECGQECPHDPVEPQPSPETPVTTTTTTATATASAASNAAGGHDQRPDTTTRSLSTPTSRPTSTSDEPGGGDVTNSGAGAVTKTTSTPTTTTEEPESVNIIITDDNAELESQKERPAGKRHGPSSKSASPDSGRGVNMERRPVDSSTPLQQDHQVTLKESRGHVGVQPPPPPQSQPQPQPQQEERLLVLDRDTLWGMLREAVHVELNSSNLLRRAATEAD